VTDLVIGARRAGGKRALRGVGVLVVVIAALAVAGLVGFRRLVTYPTPDGGISSAAPTAERHASGEPRLRYHDSSLAFAGDLAVLRLSGDSISLGSARGALLGEAMVESLDPLLATLDRAAFAGGVVGRALRGPRTAWRYRNLDRGIPGHHLVELYGLSLGASVQPGPAPDYKALVRAQASLDVGATATGADPSFRWVGRALSVATTLDQSGGERLVIARSFELPGAADGGTSAAAHRTVAFVHPEGAISYASVEWPGWIGVVSGVNAEGIAVMVHPAKTAEIDPTSGGQPAGLLARDILEHARSLDDAIGVLRAAEPLGAASFLVADGATRSVAVIERSPGVVAIRRDVTSSAVTGILTAPAFADDPENDRAARTWPEPQRAERAAEILAAAPLATPADAAALLRDRLGPRAARLPAGHRGAIDDPAAAHVAIFDVTGMVLYVADGPGALGRFRAFDLRHELRGEGSRAAPPPSIEADPAAAEAGAVLGARASLRAARVAEAEGRPREAWRRVQQALGRAADLPEALLLAGELTEARGRDEEAEDLYRRYLEAGADAPRTRETIRARLDAR
jgi:isopenicillin-N N-acyltransferase like protein